MPDWLEGILLKCGLPVRVPAQTTHAGGHFSEPVCLCGGISDAEKGLTSA